MLRYGLVASLLVPVHLLPLITLVPSIGTHLYLSHEPPSSPFFSTAFLLLFALLPESPVWLIRCDPTFNQHIFHK